MWPNQGSFFKPRKKFDTLHCILIRNFPIQKQKSMHRKVETACRNSALSCMATSVLRMRLLHVVAFSKILRWLAQTKVITLKTQLHAINACVKRLSQRSFSLHRFQGWLANKLQVVVFAIKTKLASSEKILNLT